MSFLLSRRWILFGVVVLLLAWLAWLLGEWQFSRLEDRRERNAVIERNAYAEPVPVERVLAVGEPVAPSEQWTRVEATGRYAAEDTVVVRYRTRDSQPGVEVVVPLVTRQGPALLVDRGWLATGNQGDTPENVPAPPPGEVTVVGWVRADGTGDSTRVSNGSTRAISSREIGAAIDRPVYGGFVDLVEETPPPVEPLALPELPDLDDGPHFFYGLQWWFFGLLAIVGFTWLAYDEWRGPRGPRGGSAGRSTGRSEGADHAPVDRDHRAGHERRGG